MPTGSSFELARCDDTTGNHPNHFLLGFRAYGQGRGRRQGSKGGQEGPGARRARGGDQKGPRAGQGQGGEEGQTDQKGQCGRFWLGARDPHRIAPRCCPESICQQTTCSDHCNGRVEILS